MGYSWKAWHATIDYNHVIVHDALAHGLEDKDIRLDIIGDSKQVMISKQALKYVKTKESGKRSATRLMCHSTTPTTAASTQEWQHLVHKSSRLHDTLSPHSCSQKTQSQTAPARHEEVPCL